MKNFLVLPLVFRVLLVHLFPEIKLNLVSITSKIKPIVIIKLFDE